MGDRLTNRQRYIAAFLMTAALIILFGIIVAVISGANVGKNNKKINVQWSMERFFTDGTSDSLKNSPLSQSNISSQRRGTKIVAKAIVPDCDADSMTLELCFRKTAFRLYVGSELIYSYGMDMYTNDKQIGNGYHFIPMEPEYYGETITLVMYASEKNAFGNIVEPVFVDDYDLYGGLASRNFVLLLICCFLIMFGVIISIIGALQFFFRRSFSQFLYIGMYSFLMGFYSMSSEYLIQLFCDNLVLNACIEHFTLFMLPLPVILFTMELCVDKKCHYYKALYVMACVDVIGTAVVVIEYAFNIIHLNDVSFIYRIYMFICIAVVIFMQREKKFGDGSNKLLLSGYMVMIVSSFSGIVAYIYNKYTGNSMFMSEFFMPVGNMYFVLALLFSYLLNFMTSFRNSVERQTLLNLAYRDSMTKVYNRTKSMELFEQLDMEHKLYTVIGFDLNDLKKTNDTYGHEEGDNLLINFARILDSVFGEYGSVCRMGGDEFTVVLQMDKDNNVIKDCIERMKDKIDVDNTGNHKYFMQTSYGVACTSEIEQPTSDRVCSLADKRMYEMKVAMKAGK